MITNNLSPKFAANLAADIYDALDSSIGLENFAEDYSDKLDINSNAVHNATTGGNFIKRESGFAILAKGKGNYAGHAFLIFKGTASLFDAVTDINMGARTTPFGSVAHAGFVKATEDLRKPIDAFMAKVGNVHTFHCIGHSLGGAIAHLAAEQLKAGAGQRRNVKLYTFGSPRVGDESFAQRLTQKLGKQNVFRVCHTSDPVPMVPVWPFQHVVFDGVPYQIFTPFHPFKWHGSALYVTSVSDKNNWAYLKGTARASYSEKYIQAFLNSNTPLALTYGTIDLLSTALTWVYEKVLHGLAVSLGGIFSSASSLFDRMAYVLSKNIQLEKADDHWAFLFLKRLCTALGIRHKGKEQFSHSYIRFVLTTFWQHTMDVIRKAAGIEKVRA